MLASVAAGAAVGGAIANLPEGPFSYARFHITALEYNVKEPF
jgi:hypothetical protein